MALERERDDRLVRLTVAIPTYNFGAFIGATLESVLGQLRPGVDVLVLDGASTDDTEEVVARHGARHPGAVRYVRREARGGVDRDMALAVELSRGEYVWLLSADDHASPGALAEILSRLDGAPDALLLGLRLCTFHMEPKGIHPVRHGGEERVDLHDREARIAWFRSARTTTALFSFMSSVVVRRETWLRGEVEERWYGSYWALAARLYGLLLSAPFVLHYLPGPCLDKRDDNDSFLDRGLARRVGISVEGFRSVAEAFFGPGSEEASHVRRVLRAEYPFPNLLYLKRRVWATGTAEDRRRMARLVDLLHSDGGARGAALRLAWRLAPAPLLGAAERLFRALAGDRATLR